MPEAPTLPPTPVSSQGPALLKSNRFWLVVIGVVFSLAVLGIVAAVPDVMEFAKWIVGIVNALLLGAVASDTKQRMGTVRS